MKRVNPLIESANCPEKAREMAKHNTLESVEKCPICAKAMQILSANKIPSYVCLADRISFPTKDD